MKRSSRSRSRSSSSSTSQESLKRKEKDKKRRRRSSTSSNDNSDRGKDNKRRTGRVVPPPPKSKCVGVFGLNPNTTEDKIHEIFSKYGRIKRINVIYDTKTGRSRGFCFIYYKHLKDAQDAKDSCSGMEIDYRRIRVDFSITSRPHEPTPGVYKGRSTRTDPPTSNGTPRNRRRTPSPKPQRR